ncbi:MAG: SUF system NifU family Fe-S cluster assembly protein [Actinobacteria bacterium]|nr:SUF system NifU family Fe-S cluster assembly protein [Actinomycetota bacterium]
MPGLDDLYREIILDHYRSPRNRGELETPPAAKAEGFNPLCGDEIVVYVATETNNDGDEVVSDIAIGGQGCSISQASASMMSAAVKGKTLTEVANLTSSLKSMMSIEVEGTDAAVDSDVSLGDLQALSGVVKFPVRIKCATLAWNTLAEAVTPTD